MAPFVVSLSTLLASLLLGAAAANTAAAVAEADEPFSTSASSSIPTQKQFSTIYSSTQSSAGFMFDMRAKKSLIVYGLDVNLIHPSLIQDGPETRVVVYTKAGTLQGFESDESSWDLWMNTTITSGGMDGPTSIPQTIDEDGSVEPLLILPKERRAFYISFEGPYLRYSEDDRWYYINEDVVFYGDGAAKRKSWMGTALSPRTFNGGLHYYLGDAVLDLPVELLPGRIVSESPTTSPTERPSESPTISAVPTISSMPTSNPTGRPTKRPTPKPTRQPTASPTSVEMFSTTLEDASSKPVLVYAGNMFDLKGRDSIEITTIGINTYLTTSLEIQLYIKEGGYKGAESDINQWTWIANVTVTGQGMGNPTFLPIGSFQPILLRKYKKIGFYITTDGPYLRATKGDGEGNPYAANPDVVLYQGVGKRYPIQAGTITPRIFNGAFGYHVVDIPTPSPTIHTDDLFVRNATFTPVQDTYIQNGVQSSTFGAKAQLMVDGTPERVTLMKFDISVLNGNTENEPEQILSATLRLYSMTGADFGGYVDIIPEGDIDEDTTTWDNSPYATQELGTRIGQFRSIWRSQFYEMDITQALRGGGVIPKTFLIRISSDHKNGVMWRSSDGGSENGPRIVVKFAYEPDTNKALAKLFGSDPPTPLPTFKPTIPEWSNPSTPSNPLRTYFNYNPRSSYGPERWNRVTPDGYHDKFKKLKTDVWRNKCKDGRRQSPRDLCQTNDKCLEYHETRPRRGQYGLQAPDETIARPTPQIMHNKLRLSYKERRSEFEEPIPPGADFARNGLNSGIQDLGHIDLKVRSEHRLCGKQYDAEMQLYYLHNYGNLEAISILIEADGKEDNAHFQILLDFFQSKFDGDKQLCERKQRRARALLSLGRSNDEREKQSKQLRRGSTTMSSEDASMMMDDNEAEEVEVDDSEASSPTSLGSILYQKIQNRFLRLIQHGDRQLAKDLRWDPLQPWDILKSVHFWGYSGSTTEPPCFEDVKWRIVDVPMTISPVQHIQLKKLMFDHVDPTTCRKTSTHYDESNARPVQPYRGGATYRCHRSDYASDMERAASGNRKGFVLRENWKGVDMHPWVDPEFPGV